MKRRIIAFLICLAAFASLQAAARFGFAQETASSGMPDTPVYILDAGHGGEDGGAVSAAGAKESDINLEIVLRLEQLFAFCGVETLLIRTDDRSIHDPSASTLREKKVSDLRNRVSLVENTLNSVLISVHQNSFTDEKYSGAQVFYRQDDISNAWGIAAQELLCVALDRNNGRSAKPIADTVYLMNHISCPAILVECGFLSNREEAARLQTAEYQKKIAAALFGACMLYPV